MSEPWYSPQTANHLIWATAVVLLALIALAGLIVYKRAEQSQLYTKLAAEETQRQAREAALGDRRGAA